MSFNFKNNNLLWIYAFYFQLNIKESMYALDSILKMQVSLHPDLLNITSEEIQVPHKANICIHLHMYMFLYVCSLK